MSEKSKTSGVVYINNVPKKDVRPVKMREPKVDPNAAPKTEAENTAEATTSGEEKRKQAFTYSFPTGMQDANGKNIYGNVFIVGQKEAESNERGERVNVLIPANKAKTMFRKPEHAQQFAELVGENASYDAKNPTVVRVPGTDLKKLVDKVRSDYAASRRVPEVPVQENVAQAEQQMGDEPPIG